MRPFGGKFNSLLHSSDANTISSKKHNCRIAYQTSYFSEQASNETSLYHATFIQMKQKQLGAYLLERFPPVNMMLFAILFMAVYSVAVQRWTANISLAGGILATISFFFRLRVMDEIKDYAQDAVNHPQRVLQSGGISLRFLMGSSALLSLSEIGWSYLRGGWCLVFWLLAVAYAFLMRYEFFAGAWLRKRLVLYAFSHMLIMPLVIAWLWFAWKSTFSPVLLLLMLLSFLGGFVFELARKTHAAAAERPGIDTYSSLLGSKKAVMLILGVLFAGLAAQLGLFVVLDLPLWAYALAGTCALWVTFAYWQALQTHDEKHFRKAELASSVYMLASYLVLIVGCLA